MRSTRRADALLPSDDSKTLEADGLKTTGAIKVKLEGTGQDAQVVEVREGDSWWSPTMRLGASRRPGAFLMSKAQGSAHGSCVSPPTCCWVPLNPVTSRTATTAL